MVILHVKGSQNGLYSDDYTAFILYVYLNACLGPVSRLVGVQSGHGLNPIVLPTLV